MVALILVTCASLYLVGLRADRIHAGRAVTEPTASAVNAVDTADIAAVGSVTVPLYRGHSAAYYAWQMRIARRELRRAQHANHKLRRTLSTSAAPYGTHWLERAFLCIHAGEGPWSIHNPPYDGGLQMDSDFQRTYGAWALRAFGSAGNWPISVQIAVAIRAYKSGRGFYPWPNTARACGLI